MESYFEVNVLISIVIIVLLKYGKATVSVNYCLSTLAIISWFVPYSLLSVLIPSQVISTPIVISLSGVSHVGVVSDEVLGQLDLPLLKFVFLLSSFLGLFLFSRRIVRLNMWRKRVVSDTSLCFLEGFSDKYKVPVYSVDAIKGGLLLGIYKPVILVSTEIKDSTHIDLVLTHETQHVKRNDNLRLFLLELTECLFWWNPLVRNLVKVNRFYIEASCDIHAGKEYGESKYFVGLASLILFQYQSNENSLVCSATSNDSNNVKRLRLLKEDRKMTYFNKFVITFLCVVLINGVSWSALAGATKNNMLNPGVEKNDAEGALVDFYVKFENVDIDSEVKNVEEVTTQFWVGFGEVQSFSIQDEYLIRVELKDLGESVLYSYELLYLDGEEKTLMYSPSVITSYGSPALIMDGFKDAGKVAYEIKTTTIKKHKSDVVIIN